MSIANHFLEIFAANSESLAIVESDGSTSTYGELLSDITAARSSIRAQGLGRGDRVILQVPPGRQFATWTVALVAEGATVIGIDATHGQDVYRDRAAACFADAVATAPIVRFVQRVSPSLRARVGLDAVPPHLDVPTIDTSLRHSKASSGSGGFEAAVDMLDEDTAFIIFTGGTTSNPKGVRLSNRALRAYVAALAHIPEWSAVSTIVADQPQQAMYGLAHAKTVFVTPSRASVRGAHIAELLFRRGVDAYFGSPTRWNDVLDSAQAMEVASNPKAVLLGGATVTPAILSRLVAELPGETAIRCIYGMTELGPVAHCDGRDKLIRDWAEGDYVGAIFPDVHAEVSSEGILSVSSPARFSGYLNDLNAEPSESFETGDLATVSEEELTLHGRRSDMIIADGVNLYAGQFEPRLLGLEIDERPAFAEVALVGVTVDRLGDERFVLFYRPADGRSDLRPSVVCQRVLELFPKGLGPVEAVELNSLPTKGRQAKLDRNELRTRAKRLRETPSFDDSRTRLLDQIAASGAPRPHVRAIAKLSKRNLRWAQALPRADRSTSRAFILGHQRTGTTAMHRGLCASPEATALRLPDMVVPHRATWHLTNSVAPALDRWLPLQGSRLTDIDAKHPLSLSRPEEEEWLFAALGLSGYLPSAFEETLGDPNFGWVRQRELWDDAALDEMFDLYDNIIEAWRSALGLAAEVRVVAKNPAFGPIADRLGDRYPDARFVVMVRDPSEALASRLGLIAAIHGRTLRPDEIDVVRADSINQMEAMAAAVLKIPEHRVTFVDSQRFRARPQETVIEVMTKLALALPEASSLAFLADSPPVTTPSPQPATDISSLVPEYTRLFEEVTS